MTTEEAFLSGIVDDINDITRRLVFADWLEEHDDPRGEWIRIGCELANPETKKTHRSKLEARKRQLEKSHRESLIVWERRFALGRIKEKIARAAKTEACKSAKHKGRLNPVLSEKKVVAFERKHRITLPEEYRTFLLEVGNGGLGPGDGLSSLADAVDQSPSRDLDTPFPFSLRQYSEDPNRFYDERSTEEPQPWPGVLYLATPDDPWVIAYLVVTGEDRGMVWGYGPINCGWTPGCPSADLDNCDPEELRSFFRWYEDWLDVILSQANADSE